MSRVPGIWQLVIALMMLLPLATGCGIIADKDRLVIARVDGKDITRGDLYRLLREMEDDERPNIRTKTDLLRVLDKHIDEIITIPIGKQLAAEGKINVPREIARERYFQSKGEAGNDLRFIFNIDPNSAENLSELMQVYNLTPELLRSRRDVIELKTDRILELMLAEAAVGYLAAQDFRNGQLQADEAAIAREYEFRKNELKAWERIGFRAFRFPASMPNALDEAAEVRRRLDQGETWETLEAQYLLRNREFVIESEIENNPEITKFAGFWGTVSGAQPGEVYGPVFLPEYQIQVTDAQGRPQPLDMPQAYIVLRVLESYPERVLTLEEARESLLPQILVSAEMEKLREEHAVEVFENNLPEPGGFGSEREL